MTTATEFVAHTGAIHESVYDRLAVKLGRRREGVQYGIDRQTVKGVAGQLLIASVADDAPEAANEPEAA
jgi:hypothetical protein